MTTEQPPSKVTGFRESWLWNHIGRLIGLFLFFIAIAFISLLAAAGFWPAVGLLAFLVVVFVMIAVGGRLHGL